MPSQPLNVSAKAFNSTSITVSWLKPAYPHGKIVSYVVYYQEASKENGYEKTTAIENHVFEVLLTALKAGTPYHVFVQAFTSAGGGRWSEVQKVETGKGKKQICYYLYFRRSISTQHG